MIPRKVMLSLISNSLSVISLMLVSPVAQTWAQSPTLKMTTDIPASITAPDRAETSIGTLEYFDGVPSKETSENVYDYLDKMRGVDAFMRGIPGASVRGLIVGLEEAGVDDYNKV